MVMPKASVIFTPTANLVLSLGKTSHLCGFAVCYGFGGHNVEWLRPPNKCAPGTHYTDVILGAIASQITSLAIVYSTIYSDADQRKHQSSASLAFVWGIHRDRWIPRTKGSNAENVSIWWRHHAVNGLQVPNGLHSSFTGTKMKCPDSNNHHGRFSQIAFFN